MPHHARAAGWTVEGDRMWFHRCDQCGVRRFVGTYYEVYPPLGSHDDEAGWWWACGDCLLGLISDRLDQGNEIMFQVLQKLLTTGWDTTQDEIVDRLRKHLHDMIVTEAAHARLAFNDARELLGLPRRGDHVNVTEPLALVGEAGCDYPLPGEDEQRPDVGAHCMGQDYCDKCILGEDGVHCMRCRYPEVAHDDSDAATAAYIAHRRECVTCRSGRAVSGP